ncbi:unnamed protein product [Tenebrio molitor]|nr:unnamed protein product [Tenebrio molitor]
MEKFSWKLTIKTNIFVLKLLGLWPKGNEGYEFNIYTFYAFSMKAFVDGNNLFQTVYIFYIYSDLEALAAIIFLLFTLCLDSVKAYYFMRQIRILKGLMVELESGEEFQPKQHQRVLVQPMLNVWTFIYKTLWFFYARLPFFAWYPYDTTTSPLYEITYFYQIFAAAFLAMVCLNVDTLIAVLMVFTMSQCDILCDNLKNVRACKHSDYNEKLINCIKHHQKILRYESW